MKRIFSLLLAGILLASAVPAVIAENDAKVELCADAPLSLADGAVITDGETTAAELLANFKNKRALTVSAADGTALALSDKVPSGATVSGGSDSITVIRPGDVNGDSKINARDVIGAMKVMLGQTDGLYPAAADVGHNGDTNAKDVLKLMRYLVGYEEELSPYTAERAENEDDTLTMYFDANMNRIAQSDTTVYGDDKGLIYLAGNETENAQIVLTSTEDRKDLTIEVGDIKNEAGDVLSHELRYGYYYEGVIFRQLWGKNHEDLIEDWFVDPLPLLNGQSFNIGKEQSKAFYVLVTATADSAPGWYSAPVAVKDADGKEIKRSTLRVYVWDFVLDETPACATAFHCSSGAVWEKHFEGDIDKINSVGWQALQDIDIEWYEYLLSKKISAYLLPVNDLKSDIARKYIRDPRVTSFGAYNPFNSDYNSLDLNEIVRIYTEDLAGMEDYFDKAYIYDIDEPYGMGQFEFLHKQWNFLKEKMPDTFFQVVCPLASNPFDGNTKTDFVELMRGSVNIWCPQSPAFTEFATYDMIKKYPELYPSYNNQHNWSTGMSMRYLPEARFRLKELKEQGNKLWWYICCSPEYPYANFYTSYNGVDVRMVLWQQYMNDVDGLLYWQVNNWIGVNKKRTNSGDGMIMYWGNLFGQLGPVTSTRMEDIRDGIEDFQYLTQLERLSSREEAMKYVSRVTTNMMVFTEDYRDICDTRTELGFALEDLSKSE